MAKMMAENVWISVTLKMLSPSEKAWLVDAGLEDDVWIPTSQIYDWSENEYKAGDTLEIEIPEWLAIDKDLI